MGNALSDFITRMPKVELHVHLEGSVRPETLLILAERHGVDLPAKDMSDLQEWYSFRDFNHFVEIYLSVASCLKEADDIELIAREFLAGQAAQNIRYSEVTYTAYSQWKHNGIPFDAQIDAINRARTWSRSTHGVDMGIIMDIPRNIPSEHGDMIADWAIRRFGDGIVAFGLGGVEVGNPPSKFKAAFDKVRARGIPCILHAGETVGPESIWEAIEIAGTVRIGHGVRAVEDPELMAYLRETQIPLEVSPTSNVCLKVYPSLETHSLPQLLAAGLYVTLNSDDPPMFNTTLTEEFLNCAALFGWDQAQVESLALNAVRASLLPVETRQKMVQDFAAAFAELSA